MEVSFPSGVPNEILGANISYSVKMIPGVRDYSVHWETPARPFAISGSSGMSLFVVGCGVKASLFIGNSAVEVGDCSVVCADAQVMEMLPMGTCDGVVGLGCCLIGIQVNLRAFTLNISHITDSPQSKQVHAFHYRNGARCRRPTPTPTAKCRCRRRRGPPGQLTKQTVGVYKPSA
jgi:hypothetical protein